MIEAMLYLIFIVLLIAGTIATTALVQIMFALIEMTVYLKSLARNTDGLTEKLGGIEWEAGRIADKLDDSEPVAVELGDDEFDADDGDPSWEAGD